MAHIFPSDSITIKTKSDGSRDRLTKLSGVEMQQPVILPLSRTGGCRCSVKPASRCALLSRNQETFAFAKIP
ncbi:hypothetical protein LR48_Vigan1242s000600 [Vigna angularis]|uniref:Uncharacterized protein n=1 Tax=Phaseolus angularis TaxID=3914 RepID=A0A0L9TIN9_PHAAN|nr:hypothetical protein LR48_Vigan1242s000600 [Vigna angularis]